MRVTILGSGQDGGLPQFCADHPQDSDARAGTLLERSASSVLVEVRGASILLDIGPDARAQWWSRIGAPDAIAITHAHMGHYTGLVHLGRESLSADGIRCHLTRSMLSFLEQNQPWRRLIELGNIEPELANPYRCEQYTMRLIPVPHRAEHTDTVALSIDGQVLYLPDIDSWDEWPLAESVIASHELALLDATFWSADELPGRLSDVPHPPVVETIERFAHLDTSIVLTHLNHTNPLVDPTSDPSRTVSDLGWRIARDGLTIDLPES